MRDQVEPTLRSIAASRYWREGEARIIVAAWRESGEPCAAFAQQLGIDSRRLTRWAHRVNAPGTQQQRRERVAFHPVHVRTAAERGGGTLDATMELVLPAGVVRVARGVAPEDLRTVLWALRLRAEAL